MELGVILSLGTSLQDTNITSDISVLMDDFRMTLWLSIEYAWATYPSTNLSSGLLSVAHAIIVLGLLFSPTPTPVSVPIPDADQDRSNQVGIVDMDRRKIR